MIVARGENGVLLGKAVYGVLSAYQGSTLKSLLTGPMTTFTGPKIIAKSSGDLLSTFTTGSHGGGCGSSSGCIGDLFIDHDDALVGMCPPLPSTTRFANEAYIVTHLFASLVARSELQQRLQFTNGPDPTDDAFQR